MGKILRILLAGLNSLILAFLLSACDPAMVFEDTRNLQGADWAKDSSLVFRFNITDTTLVQNIYLTTRNAGNYPFSNLFLFITTTAPTGASLKDTLEITLAHPDGHWLGKGAGDLHYLRTPWRHNVRFPYPGIYTFRIRQGMRTDLLNGIGDVGIRIEKTRN